MKAYLVKFTTTTRIVLKDNENPKNNPDVFRKAVNAAAEQMEEFGIYDYLCEENAEIEEDSECPAGTFYTDEKRAI